MHFETTSWLLERSTGSARTTGTKSLGERTPLLCLNCEGGGGAMVLVAGLGHQDVLFGRSAWKSCRAETHAAPSGSQVTCESAELIKCDTTGHFSIY